MILLDANLLLYAYDQASPRHQAAASWLTARLSGTELVLMPWHTINAFIRIATNPRAAHTPLDIEAATAHADAWLSRRIVKPVAPTPSHWRVFHRLLVQSQAPAHLVPDAHLAALAITHGAKLCSTDRDFARFDGLVWENPLAQ